MNRRDLITSLAAVSLAAPPAAASCALPADSLAPHLPAWKAARDRYNGAVAGFEGTGPSDEEAAWQAFEAAEAKIAGAPITTHADLAAFMEFIWIDYQLADRPDDADPAISPALDMWQLEKLRAYAGRAR